MTEWWQGDYVDDAGLCDDGGACERADGVGIEYGIGPVTPRASRTRRCSALK